MAALLQIVQRILQVRLIKDTVSECIFENRSTYPLTIKLISERHSEFSLIPSILFQKSRRISSSFYSNAILTVEQIDSVFERPLPSGLIKTYALYKSSNVA